MIKEHSSWILWDHTTNPPKVKIAKGAPPETAAYIKANKDACLTVAKNRYLEAPPEGITIVSRNCPPRFVSAVKAHAEGQCKYSPAVAAWIERRRAFLGDPESVIPLIELVEWQLSRSRQPFAMIADL